MFYKNITLYRSNVLYFKSYYDKNLCLFYDIKGRYNTHLRKCNSWFSNHNSKSSLVCGLFIQRLNKYNISQLVNFILN